MSVLAHALIAGAAWWFLSAPENEPRAEPLPFDLVVPDVPPPPEVPPSLPTENTAVAVKVPAAPKAVRHEAPRPAPAAKPAPKLDPATAAQTPPAPDLGSLAAVAQPDAGLPERTEMPPETPPEIKAVPADPRTASEAHTPASNAPASAATPPDEATEGLAAVDGTPGLDPSLVDLHNFVPPGSKLMLVIRVDRLRGTPWAGPLDGILAPMPDYRTIVAGTDLKITDSFETIVIATPDPEDVTSTFLAARTTRDPDELRDGLAGPAAAKGRPRVQWTDIRGVRLGTRLDPRVSSVEDPRVFVQPEGGWIVLARPEHVPHLFAKQEQKAPEWLNRLGAVEAQTGEGETAPFVVFSASDLEGDELQVPGGAALPMPKRITITMAPDPDGVIARGAAVFDDEATAKTFYESALEAQEGALHSLATKLILDGIHCKGAVQRLQIRQSGGFVTFSTTIGVQDATALFNMAAVWSKDYFRKARHKPRSSN